jgi:hypothetical protein
MSRRQVLKGTSGAALGLAGTGGQNRTAVRRSTLTMLSAITVPAWTKPAVGPKSLKANKCRVKIDFIAHRDTYVKVAKEQEGHDIVFLFFSKPNLHHEDLETLDFMEDLGQKLGGWHNLAREACQVEGRWVALPWFYIPMPTAKTSTSNTVWRAQHLGGWKHRQED